MCPPLGFEFPDSGVGLAPSFLDGVDGDGGGGVGVGVEPVGVVGGGEELQRFSEGVELELVVDVVAEGVGAAGVAGQVQGVFVGDGLAGGGVGGCEVGAVFEQAGGDEPDGVVEQVVGAGGGGGLPGEALVPDPGVAVVVVAARSGAFGKAHGGGGDHGAGVAGESA
ncbi:hypothetical protein GCM10023321_44790 [Pseudonocardia eucalypti]|uniref:Uncharacterized protein n=1 Tax=Pseudonocardia eucalypti TaxID=648755 RepID=A0ABP9QFI9_9PSEU